MQIFQRAFQKRFNVATTHFAKSISFLNPSKNKTNAVVSSIILGSGFTTSAIYVNTNFYSSTKEENEFIEFACVIQPHPTKRKTGGEDAFYVSKDLKSFGVADGVGGWANHGVDPGIYSKRLMTLMKAEEDREENKNKFSLVDSISTAHKIITKEKIQGSTTLCFVKIIDKVLKSYYLGDSSYMIIPKDRTTFYKSPEQQKSFNFPYQLGSEGDKVSDGRKGAHPISEGDIILVGTDGVFDNLHDHYIHKIIQEDHEKSAMDIASRIVNEASLVAFNKHPAKGMHITPFQVGSRGQFSGGKPDDMTMIVAKVKSL